MFSGQRAKILFLVLAGALYASVGAAAPGSFTNELWSLVIRDASDVCPAVAPDGTIYLGTFTGKLWAITPAGKEKWIFQAGREIKSSPALGDDGTIYFGCRDRKFYAVTAQGKLKWTFKTGAWNDSSPAIGADGTIYFGSWDGNFYALDRAGSRRWEFKTDGPIVSSPAVGFDGKIYFGSHDKKFYAITPRATKAWEYTTGGPITSSPAVDKDGTLYFTSVDGVFHAVNADGTLKWCLKTSGVTESSPVIGEEGTLYICVNQDLWAIDSAGKKKWEQPWGLNPPVLIRTSPVALADGSVYFAPGYGTLANVTSPLHVEWINLGYWLFTPAVASHGALYAVTHVLNVGQVLKAFEGKGGPAHSSWPKFRADAQNTGRAVRALE